MRMGSELDLCRFCMGQNNLQDKSDDGDFHEKVYECMSLKMQSNSEYLPTTVCLLCVLRMEDLCEFRRKCLRVQSVLWSMIQDRYGSLEEHLLREPDDALAAEPITAEQKEDYEENMLLVEPVDTIVLNEAEPNQIENVTSCNNVDFTIEETDSEEHWKEPECRIQEDVSLPTVSNLQRRDEKKIYRSLLNACNICGKMVEKNRLQGHLNRHQDLKPYVCSEKGCGAQFPCKIALRLHHNNRHSTQPHVCSLCSKIFKSMKALSHHRSTYHSNYIFICGVCSKVFKSKKQLKHHQSIHTGERKYACSHCCKAFHRKSNLTVHTRTHTKERPYGCKLCSKSFGYARVLKEHMRRIHKESLSNLEA